MALMKSFLSNVKNVWQSPEQAVIEEDIADGAFVASDSFNGTPSTDTVNADVITNTYTAPAAETKKSQTNNIYANSNNYIGDGYEDLTDVNFSVAKSASFEEEPQLDQDDLLEETIISETTIAAAGKFKGFVDTRFLFEGQKAEASAAVVNTEPVREVNFTPVVPLDEIFAPKKQETVAEVKEIREERKPEIVAKPSAQESIGVKADNVVKASVGFNTATATVNTTSFTSSKFTTGGKTMASEKISVQILKPTRVEDVSEACSILKEGSIIMAVLSGIPDKNARLRYLDYLSGCCKGCDADFKEIVKVDSIDCVLVAAPRGVGLKFPVLQAYATQQAAQTQEEESDEQEAVKPQAERPSAFSSVFGNVDLGGGKGAATNWYTDRF